MSYGLRISTTGPAAATDALLAAEAQGKLLSISAQRLLRDLWWPVLPPSLCTNLSRKKDPLGAMFITLIPGCFEAVSSFSLSINSHP